MGSARERIHIAIVGCGRWGFNHVRVFSQMSNCVLVAVADVDPERRRAVREHFPGVRVERDYENLLRDPAVDAIVVATPASTHYDIVRHAVEHGKQVLCEKPLCENVQQAQQLVRFSLARNIILMVGHVFLFNAGIVKLKELVDTGEIGTLHHLAAIRTNLGPIRHDVNAAYDLASHDISIFNWLMGALPETVSASGSSFFQPGIEDVVFITLKYPRGVLANIQVSWFSPQKTRQITAVGSQKMVKWDDMVPDVPITIFDKSVTAEYEYKDYRKVLRLSLREGKMVKPQLTPVEPLRQQGEYFLQCVRKGSIERSDGHFSLGVVRILEAVNHSLRNNGAPVAPASFQASPARPRYSFSYPQSVRYWNR